MQILEHILKKKQSRNFGNQLATIWHCEMWFFALRILQNGFSHCEFRKMVFRIAKFRIAKFAVKFRIAKFRIAKFAVKFRIAKFSHCEFSHCEIFALCEQFAKIPTVLPSNFV